MTGEGQQMGHRSGIAQSPAQPLAVDASLFLLSNLVKCIVVGGDTGIVHGVKANDHRVTDAALQGTAAVSAAWGTFAREVGDCVIASVLSYTSQHQQASRQRCLVCWASFQCSALGFWHAPGRQTPPCLFACTSRTQA